MTLLTGGIQTTRHNFPLVGELWNAVKRGWKTVLFIEALRNLAWSRGYLWYVELDGVPNPFQRGGVLGLPCADVQFPIGGGESFDITASTINMKVPQRCSPLETIQLDLYDDEQGTIYQFFERWYNEVYNPYYGVLPVTEACKQISIYRQKASRRNVKRVWYDIDSTATDVLKMVTGVQYGVRMPKDSDAYEFLVYPTNQAVANWQTDNNGLQKLNVTLQIAYFVNQDFGNPNENSGVKTIFDIATSTISNGKGWLDKLGDYI